MANTKKSRGKKPRYPSKDEILKALLDDKKLVDFEKLILIVEHKKTSKNIGIIKGELLQNDKVIFRGKMTEFPETTPDSFDWDELNIGESYYQGFSLDYKGEKISELFIQGLKNSIKKGKIPFVPI